MMAFRFADPWWLALAPVVFLAIAIHRRRRGRPSVLYSSADDLSSLPRSWRLRLRPGLVVLEALALLLLVFAMARPQAGREEERNISEGIAIELVIDKSGSMRMEDLDPDAYDRKVLNRLDVVRDVVRDFVDEGGDLPGRSGDLVGLISFAGYVQVHCPLTLDHHLVLGLLPSVQIPRTRDRELLATALGDALATAVDRIKDCQAKSRVIILLSDGQGTIGVTTAAVAAEAARGEGIKVYTIGVGSAGTALDEQTLEDVAQTTGGRYFNVRDQSGLKRVYEEIDRLERTEVSTQRHVSYKERFGAVLLCGVALLLLHRILAETLFRSLP